LVNWILAFLCLFVGIWRITQIRNDEIIALPPIPVLQLPIEIEKQAVLESLPRGRVWDIGYDGVRWYVEEVKP
jgi:hypothetical protein